MVLQDTGELQGEAARRIDCEWTKNHQTDYYLSTNFILICCVLFLLGILISKDYFFRTIILFHIDLGDADKRSMGCKKKTQYSKPAVDPNHQHTRPGTLQMRI